LEVSKERKGIPVVVVAKEKALRAFEGMVEVEDWP